MNPVHDRAEAKQTEPFRTVSGHLALLDELGTKIASGDLAAGEVITLAGLEAELNVSRTAVREVIRVLENLGMVRSKRRVGITVLPRAEWSILDPQLIVWRMANPKERQAFFVEMSELRRGIEPEAARLAASRASMDAGLELKAMAERLQELGSQGLGAEKEFLDIDKKFHGRLLECSSNEIFGHMASLIESLLTERTYWQLQPAFPSSDAMAAHVRLADSIVRRDADGAWEAASFIVSQAEEEVRASDGEVERR